MKLRVLLILLVVPIIFGGGWLIEKQKANRERAKWKVTALEDLQRLSITNAEVHEEFDQLKASRQPGLRWAGDHVLVMTNGEYVLYKYRHGSDGLMRIEHLLLGHGSNNRWYYSSFHFCRSMAMIMGDEPPGSIEEFAQRYAAREFDGKSDECLKPTWPPR